MNFLLNKMESHANESIVSTFVNPHLFWIMNGHDNVKRDKVAKMLQQLLKESRLVYDLDCSFEAGELVVLQLDDKLYRGIIEVNNEDVDGLQILKNGFLCWLIDYGILVLTTKVYKLPAELRKIPPLALQVSLNHVAYLQQHLKFDEAGQPATENEILTTPTGLSRDVSLELLSKAKTIEFHLDQKDDGINYGDILYEDKDGNKKSLKDELIKAKVLIEDKEGFKEIKNSIHEYRDHHLPFICSISRKTSQVLNETNKNKNLEQLVKHFPFLTTPKAKNNYLINEDDRGKKLQKIASEKLQLYGDLEDVDENSAAIRRVRTPRSENKRYSNIESKHLLLRNELFYQEYDKQDMNKSNSEKGDSDTPNMDAKKENRITLLMKKLRSERKSANVSDVISPNRSSSPIPESNIANNLNIPLKHANCNSAAAIESFSSDDSSQVKKQNLLSSTKLEFGDSDDCHVDGINSTYSVSSDECPEKQKEIKLDNTPVEEDTKKTSYVEKPSTCVTPSIAPLRNIVIMPAGAEHSLSGGSRKSKAVQDSKVTNNSYAEKRTFKQSEITCVDQNGANSCDKAASALEQLPENNPQALTNNYEQVPQINVKPKCSCTQCDMWTHESIPKLRGKNSLPDDVPEPDPRNFLFKTETEESDVKVNIVSLNYGSMTAIEKQMEQKLLVHSQSIPKPTKLLSNVNFHPDVYRTLMQEDYKEAKRIQMYSWPALLRNQHTFLVHGPGTGKTIAYLPVICSFLWEKSERYNLTKSGGPLAIILCSNSKKCEETYILSKMLLGQNKLSRNNKLKVCLVTPPITHINATNIDLLITTPSIIIDLLKNRVINFKKLCHFILEDGDKVLKRDSLVMDKIFTLIQSMLMNRVESKSVQVIVCAEHWNTRMENLLKSLQKTPMVCIGNYLEAALYGRMSFSMRFIISACKEQELKDILKDTYRIRKSIVLCKTDEIEEVKTILMLKGIDSTVIEEDLSKEDILFLEESWTKLKAGHYRVLVCTDFLLMTTLNITCASLLIHYSLPGSWSKFVKRFGCLLESLRSPLQETKKTETCQSIVLVDEMCEEQLKKFFNYINSTGLNKQLPEKLKRYSEGLKEQEEEKKVIAEIALCSTLKLFGKCPQFNCPRRHILCKSLDLLADLPKKGKIKFKIIESHDVTSFSLKLLEYTDNENNIHDCAETVDITEEVTDTLRITRNKVHPHIGQHVVYCDIDEADGVFYRCQVIDMENETVKGYLLDRGTYVCTVKSRLYKLPKEFSLSAKPAAVLEGYMANYVPPYNDENFSNKSFYNIKSLLERHDYINKVFVAYVSLQLGYTLWLEDVHEEVQLSDRIVPGFQLSREVLQLKLIDIDKQQLGQLYGLCKTADIPVIKVEKKQIEKIEQQQVTPQWAFLEMGNINEVIFCAAVSPDEFYVRHYKYSDLLYVLQKEIQAAIKKPNYPELTNVHPGMVCLAHDSLELEYCRVMVVKTENDKALCFFVDFGDEIIVPINKLLYIPSHFITKLPFQSIQCKLHGLAPILDEWYPDVVNTLYNYSVEPQTDIFRSLYVKVLAKDQAVFPCQTKYSILIKDGFGEKNVLINQLLIDCGLALSNSEAFEDFEIPTSKNESLNSGDEDNHEGNEYGYFSQNAGYCNDEDSEGLEFFANDIGDFIKQYILVPQKEPEKKIDRELPTITAVPAVDYYTPEVYWHQTETAVRLSIKLVDVIQCEVILTKGRIFCFSCFKDDRKYLLKLMLYEKIDTMQHTQGGSDIRVTLTKSKMIDWPRLILSKQKTRNIHYDLSKINVPEEKQKKILELPKELDDPESDSEVDVMYVECSDLDSDFDVDLPQDSD